MINNSTSPDISIVIPTLNEARGLPATLQRLTQLRGNYELLIVDGGSSDETRRIVRRFPSIRLLTAERGRARQLNKGASAASGSILFFLHADTLPPADALLRILEVLEHQEAVAGSFYTRFDNNGWGYRVISAFSRLNLSFLTFGDQGLFLRKSTFLEMDGFPGLPLMEDLAFQRRLRRRGKFVKIQQPLLTSARRFERNGFFRQVVIDFFLLLAFYLRVPLEWLKKWYPDTEEHSR